MSDDQRVEAVAEAIFDAQTNEETTHGLARAAIAAYCEALEASGWQVVPKTMTAMMFAAADEERNPEDMWSQALHAAPTPENDHE